jgi:predicted permease
VSLRPQPPRFARSLLTRALPDDIRDAIVGDLDEVYGRRLSNDGSWRTLIWYWGQVLSFSGRFLRERFRELRSHRRGPRRVNETRGRRRKLAGIGGWWLDVKLALRMLVKFPGLSLVGIFAIAVGIAVTAGYFELANKLIDPKLPLEDGDRIILIENRDLSAGRPDFRSLYDFPRWRGQLESVEQLGAYQIVFRNLITPDGRAEPMRVTMMTASGFSIARVPPLLGRPLFESDEQPGAPPVAVIGHDLWHSRFGADSAIVGETIQLGASHVTVVGVMPKAFLFPVRDNLWVPLGVPRSDLERLTGADTFVFGRLAPGITLLQAQSEVQALGARWATDLPEPYARIRPHLKPFTHRLFEPSDRWTIYAAEGFLVMVLVVACINVATLVFARTAMRQNELAVRITLGASRARIIFQLFVEALALSLIASAIGLFLARWGVKKVMVGEGMLSVLPFWWDVGMPLSTVFVILVLAVLSAGIAGVVPALKVTGRRGQGALRQLVSSAKELRFGGFSTAVIVFQVATSVAFLSVGFGMGREVMTFHTGTGELPSHPYMAARLLMDREQPPNLDDATYQTEFLNEYTKAYEELARRLVSAVEVEDLTFANALPGTGHPRAVVELDAVEPNGDRPSGTVSIARVDPGFFEALDTPLITGRHFASADAAAAGRVAIVNQPFVRRFLAGRNPIGYRVRHMAPQDSVPQPWFEIIGVVPDLGMNPSDPGDPAGIYYPATARQLYPVSVAIRLRREQGFASEIRRVAADVDPTLRVEQPMPLRDLGVLEREPQRFAALMVTVVAGMILVLSMAGIYALMAFAVTQRTREIGIRTALGAHPRRILATIFARGLVQLFAGLALGSVVAVWFYGFAEWLDGGADAVMIVTVVMMASGILACAVPARRALRIQPTEALREA